MSPPMRLRTAVFTISRDDNLRLSHWLHYYSNSAPFTERFVLDHGTYADHWMGKYANLLPIHNAKAFDHAWLTETVQHFNEFLLQAGYERVIFAAVDEFLVPDPARWRNLTEFLNSTNDVHIRATGYEVLHLPDEPDLHWGGAERTAWSLGWLAQRRMWTPSALYSKQLINRNPVNWGRGFHDASRPCHPYLALVHTHRMDFKETLARHKRAVAAPWSAQEIESGHGQQSRIVDEQQCRAFCAGLLNPRETCTPEPIPERYRNAL